MRGGLRRADAGCGPGRCEQRQGAGRAEASRVEAGSLCGAGRGELMQGAGLESRGTFND